MRTFAKVCVGRQRELTELEEFVATEEGQCALTVGQAGMGKSTLVQRFCQSITKHPTLRCWTVRYSPTPGDSASAVMGRVLHDLALGARALGVTMKSERRNKQIDAIFQALDIPTGRRASAMREAFASLRPIDPSKSTREQLLERLSALSKCLGQSDRCVFVIDPEKYLREDGVDEWRLLIPELPARIKVIFCQRPEDRLNVALGSQKSVRRIPATMLDVLSDDAVSELVALCKQGTDIHLDHASIMAALRRFQNHPYAVSAALQLLSEGRSLEELPADPTPESIAAVQWNLVCRRGQTAMRLLAAYAIVEVRVPHDMIEAIAQVTALERQHLMSDPYLQSLIVSDADDILLSSTAGIYHTLLRDRIRETFPSADAKDMHRRAARAFEARLEIDPLDSLAASRLPRHVLEVSGPDEAALLFLDKSLTELCQVGEYDAAADCAAMLVAQDLRPETRLRIEIWSASLLGLRGQTAIAEEKLTAILKEAEALQSNRLMSQAESYLADLMRSKGNLLQAEQLYQSAINHIANCGRPDAAIWLFVMLADVRAARGGNALARKTYEAALRFFESVDSQEGIMIVSSRLSRLLINLEEIDAAEPLAQRAYALAREQKSEETIAYVSGSLGLIARRKGDALAARDHHTRALRTYERLEQLADAATERGHLGIAYQMLGDSDAAKQCYIDAIRTATTYGLREVEAAQSSNLGLLLIQIGDEVEAERYLQRALRANESIGRPSGIAIVCANLGELAWKKGDGNGALTLWKRSAETFRAIGALRDAERIEQSIRARFQR